MNLPKALTMSTTPRNHIHHSLPPQNLPLPKPWYRDLLSLLLVCLIVILICPTILYGLIYYYGNRKIGLLIILISVVAMHTVLYLYKYRVRVRNSASLHQRDANTDPAAMDSAFESLDAQGGENMPQRPAPVIGMK